jgi:hypothetical protein
VFDSFNSPQGWEPSNILSSEVLWVPKTRALPKKSLRAGDIDLSFISYL